MASLEMPSSHTMAALMINFSHPWYPQYAVDHFQNVTRNCKHRDHCKTGKMASYSPPWNWHACCKFPLQILGWSVSTVSHAGEKPTKKQFFKPNFQVWGSCTHPFPDYGYIRHETVDQEYTTMPNFTMNSKYCNPYGAKTANLQLSRDWSWSNLACYSRAIVYVYMPISSESEYSVTNEGTKVPNFIIFSTSFCGGTIQWHIKLKMGAQLKTFPYPTISKLTPWIFTKQGIS